MIELSSAVTEYFHAINNEWERGRYNWSSLPFRQAYEYSNPIRIATVFFGGYTPGTLATLRDFEPYRFTRLDWKILYRSTGILFVKRTLLHFAFALEHTPVLTELQEYFSSAGVSVCLCCSGTRVSNAVRATEYGRITLCEMCSYANHSDLLQLADSSKDRYVPG
jgi:hypothetical protein